MLLNKVTLSILVQSGSASDRQSKDVSTSGNGTAAAPQGQVTVSYWYRCAHRRVFNAEMSSLPFPCDCLLVLNSTTSKSYSACIDAQ